MLDAQKNQGASKPYLRNTNVQWMRLILDNVKEMRIEAREEEELRLKHGDLLICEGGEPGRCAIWRDDVPEMYFQKALHRIRPCNAILSEFLALNLQIDCKNEVLSAYFTGATIKHLTGRSLGAYPIPVPPLAEQRRIVAKVDELMALIAQLEAHLTNAKSASTALLDAAIHELLNPSAIVVDRAGIGCYVVQKLASHKTFGRVALMKHEYLAEAHIGAILDGQYQRQAAGPLDSWVYRFEEDAIREGWFTVGETKMRDGHKKIIYRKGAELDAKASAAFAALPQAQRDELDRVLALLGGKPTEEVEIIATLFAVWNDSLIDGHSPSDENIVTGFREHWHEKKQKFAAKSLHVWLDWMRRNGLVPTGRGPRTQSHPTLDLH